MAILQMRRNSVLCRISSLLLCATQILVLSGCAQSLAPDRGTRADPVNGETLYRGIFFGQANFLEKVPELRYALSWNASLNQTQRAAVNGFVDKLVLAMRTEKGFFDAFANEMQSGDQIRISRMLDHASAVTQAALDRIPEVANWRTKLVENREAVQAELVRQYNAGNLSQNDVAAARAQLSLLVAANGHATAAISQPKWWIGVAIALAVVVVAPPLLAVAVAYFIAYAYSTDGASAGALTRDRIVDALATRLVVVRDGVR